MKSPVHRKNELGSHCPLEIVIIQPMKPSLHHTITSPHHPKSAEFSDTDV